MFLPHWYVVELALESMVFPDRETWLQTDGETVFFFEMCADFPEPSAYAAFVIGSAIENER